MLKTKYFFLKKLYPEYVIIFEKNRNYYVLYDDDDVIIYFFRKKLISNLKRYHINYMIMDHYDVKEKEFFLDNRYQELLLKGILIKKMIEEGRNLYRSMKD